MNFFEDVQPFYPATVNHEGLHQHFLRVAANVVGSENVKELKVGMGAEDFSFFAEAIPGYFYMVGMENVTEGPLKSGHSPHYRVNEAALPYGAALQASLAATYLLEHQLGSRRAGSSHDEL